MLNVRHRRAVKVLLYAITLIIIYLLQTFVFAEIRLLCVKPLLIPLAVVGVAIFEGSMAGGVFGIFAGMLFDISYSQPLIEYTILFTLLGIVIGLLSDYVLSRRFPSYLLCCVIVLIIIAAVQVLGMALFSDAEMSDLIDVAWKQTVYSIIFILPLYFPVKAIGRI